MRARRLHVVTGKGGVGKSTISAALALAAGARGRRVLAIELSGPGGLCRILGATPPEPGAIREAGDGVSLTYFDGAAALAEYLTRKVRLGRFLGPVLDHPIYRAFVGAAPGVRELMAIGKVRDELRRRDGFHHVWDTVVVDAGSSGSALSYLRIPGAAARAFTAGRVHRESSRIDALLRDPATTAVHIVATAEKMPLAEAAQVVETVTGELSMPIGAVLINQCRPTPPADISEVVARLGPAGPGGVLADVARRSLGWQRAQDRDITALEAEIGLVTTRLPRVWLAGARGVAAQLAEPIAEVTL